VVQVEMAAGFAYVDENMKNFIGMSCQKEQ